MEPEAEQIAAYILRSMRKGQNIKGVLVAFGHLCFALLAI